MDSRFAISENYDYNSIKISRIGGNWLESNIHDCDENELIIFTSGHGYILIKEKTISFQPGDIFFWPSHFPHRFQIMEAPKVSATLLRFRPDIFGSLFLNLPECHYIKLLLKESLYGLQIFGESKYEAYILIDSFLKVNNFQRLIKLLQYFNDMSKRNEYIKLTTELEHEANKKKAENINEIFRFTLERFNTSLSLHQVASVACMSVASFCNYFKQHTHKTYNYYLNEVRINYACQQLRTTNKSVSDIGYESGFNTIAHFHRQFLKFTKKTPLQYRKKQNISKKTINVQIPA